MASFDLKSSRIIIEAENTEGHTEWQPDHSPAIHIVSLHIFPVNVVIGDTVTIEFYVGTTKVAEYAKDIHLSNSPVTMTFDRQDPLEIPYGVTIKVIYTAIDSNGRDLIIWTQYKKP